MKNPDRNTKYYFLELVEKNSSGNEILPSINHLSKVHDEISLSSSEFKYCVFHTHEHLEIFYFEKGNGVFETQTTKTPIKANDVIIVNHGAVHRIYSKGEPLEYFNLAVTNFYYHNYKKNSVSDSEFIKITLKNKQNNLYSTLRKAELRFKKDGLRTLSAYSAVYEVLDLLTQTISASQNKTARCEPYRLTEKIKNYILENYDKDLTIEELSKRFFISKSYLGHAFKQEYGVSPIKFLIKTRIEQAKVLLLCTDKNITEISNEIGFSNSNYFTYYFTKQVGKTPSEFRNNKSV